MGGLDSYIANVDVGVPQVSCLRSLLFYIYIMEIPKDVKAFTIFMYADDTNLTLHSQEISQRNETMNDDLKYVDLWMQGNKLSINVSKNPVNANLHET